MHGLEKQRKLLKEIGGRREKEREREREKEERQRKSESKRKRTGRIQIKE